jgi:hypothetical protein
MSSMRHSVKRAPLPVYPLPFAHSSRMLATSRAKLIRWAMAYWRNQTCSDVGSETVVRTSSCDATFSSLSRTSPCPLHNCHSEYNSPNSNALCRDSIPPRLVREKHHNGNEEEGESDENLSKREFAGEQFHARMLPHRPNRVNDNAQRTVID